METIQSTEYVLQHNFLIILHLLPRNTVQLTIPPRDISIERNKTVRLCSAVAKNKQSSVYCEICHKYLC